MGHGVMFRAVFDSGVWMQWRRRNMGEMGNRRRPERNEPYLIVCLFYYFCKLNCRNSDISTKKKTCNYSILPLKATDGISLLKCPPIRVLPGAGRAGVQFVLL